MPNARVSIATITLQPLPRQRVQMRIVGISTDTTYIINRNALRKWRGRYPHPPLK